jgi:hypothetical protein
VDKLKGKSFIVLVRTSSNVLSWTDVEPSLISVSGVSQNTVAPKNNAKAPAPAPAVVTTTTTTTTTVSTAPASNPVVFQESVCEVGLDLQDCKADEECVPVQVSNLRNVFFVTDAAVK